MLHLLIMQSVFVLLLSDRWVAAQRVAADCLSACLFVYLSTCLSVGCRGVGPYVFERARRENSRIFKQICFKDFVYSQNPCDRSLAVCVCVFVCVCVCKLLYMCVSVRVSYLLYKRATTYQKF